MYFQLLLSLFLIIESSNADDDWSYKDADKWSTQFPELCGGNRQSPINIEIKNTKHEEGSLNLIWKNYDNIPKSMSLNNTGRSAQVDVQWNDEDEVPSITSNIFDGEYIFAQANFHWGPTDDSGSEHTVDGKSYPLELHLVHYKKNYNSFEDAIKHKDGVVVIAELYEVVDSGPSTEHIAPYIDDIKEVGSTVDINVFPLSTFYAVNSKNSWIAYSGSLTTARCREVVTWIVSYPAYQVARIQVEKLRSIKLAQGDDHNNRPVQPLNGRDVCFYDS